MTAPALRSIRISFNKVGPHQTPPWDPQTYIFRGFLMVNNWVFGWPKPLCFGSFWGAHGSYK